MILSIVFCSFLVESLMQTNFVKSRISGLLNYRETKALLAYNPNFDFRTPLQYVTENNNEIDIILCP